MTAESLNGYHIGQTVEARCSIDADWEKGTVVYLDRADAELPYGVDWADRSDWTWVRPNNIRPVEGERAPGRLQYRIGETGRFGEWRDVVAGANIPIPLHGSRLVFREAPPRTDAEILAKLRERVEKANVVELTRNNLRRVLNGDF